MYVHTSEFCNLAFLPKQEVVSNVEVTHELGLFLLCDIARFFAASSLARSANFALKKRQSTGNGASKPEQERVRRERSRNPIENRTKRHGTSTKQDQTIETTKRTKYDGDCTVKASLLFLPFRYLDP